MVRKLITYLTFGFLVAYLFLVIVPMAWLCRLRGQSEEVRHHFHRHASRFFGFYTRHCLPGVRTEVRNASGETFERPALVIANHQSLLDLPATLMLHDRMIAVVGRWVWESRIYGQAVRYAGYLPATMSLEEMLPRIQERMQHGYSLLIFPEGTRSVDGQVHKFRRGAFHIAEQLQCDVVPVTLCGTGQCLPKLDFCLRPGRILVEVGERVTYASGLMGQTHSEMTRRWHQWFVQNFQRLAQEPSK